MRHIASFLTGVAATIVIGGYGFVCRPLPMADGASDLAGHTPLPPLPVAEHRQAHTPTGTPRLSGTDVTRPTLAPPLRSPGAKFYSYLSGEQWEFSVTTTDLRMAPAWRAANEAPPLPPRAALRSARRMLERLLPSGSTWELHRVSLQPMQGVPDAWVYLVDFTSPVLSPPGVVGSVIGSQVTLVVLMDGRAVAPVVVPRAR